MSKQKPTLPKGMRDFGPEVMMRRNYILNIIKATFEKFGYLPLETPAMENLSVLTGTYGEEGDKLLYKVLNSGDFLSKTKQEDIDQGSKKLAHKIAEKGLKYDLTVPFARYVAMNRHDIAFPFKRYQIQPVWRADRPQRGRYREFYQCDADVVGTKSLICEAEILLMINEVFEKLGITDYEIKINNRKILTGIAEVINEADKVNDLCIAIDKLDKIGIDKVEEELKNRGFSDKSVAEMRPLLNVKGNNAEKLDSLKSNMKSSELGTIGVTEIQEVLDFIKTFNASNNNDNHVVFDATLARGLSYYTGCIFEVKVNNVSIGSVSGGGRYDDLTGIFGMPDVSGVGFSFGVDRLYDVMEELDLFPKENLVSTQVMIVNFDKESALYSLGILKKLRDAEIKSELYPEATKLKKQMTYANKKAIPYVLLIGADEITSGNLTLKNMQDGSQEKLKINEIISKF